MSPTVSKAVKNIIGTRLSFVIFDLLSVDFQELETNDCMLEVEMASRTCYQLRYSPALI